MTTPQIRCKVWFEIDGKPLIGNGRERLLEAIHENGSISAAAKVLGIPYRKIWAQVHDMEKIAPFPLFLHRTGGRSGGATVLTDQARRLLYQFQEIGQEIRATVDDICQVRTENGFFNPDE